MAGARMAANGNVSLVFIEDVTAGKGGRMNCEVYMTILSAQIQSNAGKLIRVSHYKPKSSVYSSVAKLAT